jgi:hypothetical protein
MALTKGMAFAAAGEKSVANRIFLNPGQEKSCAGGHKFA